MTKGDIAKQIFLSGVNCSSSVVLAFKNELNMEQSVLEKLSIGFGGGFGRQRLVCGAVSGMTMVLSYLLSDGKNKADIYAVINEGCKRFKAEAGTVVCAELLNGIVKNDGSVIPENRTAEYYKKRPCGELVADAASILERYIVGHPPLTKENENV